MHLNSVHTPPLRCRIHYRHWHYRRRHWHYRRQPSPPLPLHTMALAVPAERLRVLTTTHALTTTHTLTTTRVLTTTRARSWARRHRW